MKSKSIFKISYNRPFAIAVMALGIFICSCSSDDPVDLIDSEPATVQFSSTSFNIEENSSSTLNIDLSLSESLEESGSVTISIDNGSTATSSDFSTYPAASSETINIILPEGATAASFSVTPIDNNELNDNRTIILIISSADGGVELAGSDLTATVTISNDDVASDQLVFNENFDYGTTTGDLTALSSWEIFSGTENPIQYIPDGLSFEGYGSSAVGGAATFEGGSGSREDLQRQFDPQTLGTIYLAQVINISTAEANETGDFFLSLRNASDAYFMRLYAKDNGSGKLILGTARSRSGTDPITFSNVEYSYDTNYLVVLKYDFDTKDASMFVFSDSVPATEPETPAALSNTGPEPSDLEEVVIRQGANAMAGTIGGIRIATTWEMMVDL